MLVRKPSIRDQKYHMPPYSKNTVNSKISIISFGIYIFIGLSLILPGTIASLQYEYQSQQLFVILLIFFVINGCVGASVLLVRRFVSETENKYPISYISNAHIIINSLLLGFWLFCQSYSGACTVDDMKYLKEWGCNPGYSSHLLPFESLIFAMMTPLLYAFIFPNASWKVSMLSWIIILAWISVCIGVFSAYNTIKAFVVYIGFSLMILIFMYERHRQSVSLFLEKEKCEFEILRVVEQSQKDAKEIQNTLSNMVHDLKTVRTNIIVPQSFKVCYNFYYIFSLPSR